MWARVKMESERESETQACKRKKEKNESTTTTMYQIYNICNITTFQQAALRRRRQRDGVFCHNGRYDNRAAAAAKKPVTTTTTTLHTFYTFPPSISVYLFELPSNIAVRNIWVSTHKRDDSASEKERMSVCVLYSHRHTGKRKKNLLLYLSEISARKRHIPHNSIRLYTHICLYVLHTHI